MFSSRKCLIPVCVLGIVPQTHGATPAPAPQIAYSHYAQKVLHREGKAWLDEQRVSGLLCSVVCTLEHDTDYTSGIWGREPSLQCSHHNRTPTSLCAPKTPVSSRQKQAGALVRTPHVLSWSCVRHQVSDMSIRNKSPYCLIFTKERLS